MNLNSHRRCTVACRRDKSSVGRVAGRPGAMRGISGICNRRAAPSPRACPGRSRLNFSLRQAASTTLSDRVSDLIRGQLYFSTKLGMLGLRGQPRGGAPIAPADDLARGLQGVLRSSRARGGVAAVCPGAAQRQRPQVDGSDAGAGDRSGSVSILSAFHHRRSLECRPGMAAAARAGARAHGRPDHRRHQLSQARDPLGRGRAAVLRRAGQGGQLPGGGHRGAVDGRAGLSARGGALSPESVADRRGAHAGQDSRGGALSRTVAAGVGPDPPGGPCQRL